MQTSNKTAPRQVRQMGIHTVEKQKNERTNGKERRKKKEKENFSLNFFSLLLRLPFF
jgi:hypothetical protein